LELRGNDMEVSCITRIATCHLGCDVVAFIIWIHGRIHIRLNLVLNEVEQDIVLAAVETHIQLLALSSNPVWLSVLTTEAKWIDV